MIWSMRALSGLLVVTAAVVLAQTLTGTERPPLPEDVPPVSPPPPPTPPSGGTWLLRVGNPVTVSRETVSPDPDIREKAKYLGGYTIAERENSDVAFLQVVTGNLYVNAYRGEPITSQGQVVADLRGWTLVRLTDGGAVFGNGPEEVELREAGDFRLDRDRR